MLFGLRVIPGFVVCQRLDIKFICIKEIDVGISHELHPVVLYLSLVGRPLLEAQILILKHFLVENIFHLKGSILIFVKLKLFLNDK